MPITHCAIFLTEKCNLACTYCYLKNIATARDMSEKTGIDVIDFLLLQVKEYLSISFFGGEPLLKFDLMKKLISHARKRAEENEINITFSINTNGILIDREKIDYLRKNRMGIVLSIDGIPESHDTRRMTKEGEGSFNLLNNITLILLEDPRQVHIRMTVTPDTVSKMFYGVKFIHDIGFRSLAVAMERTDPGWTGDKRKIFADEYKKIVDWYIDMLREGDRFKLVDLDYGAASLDHPYREKGMPCEAGQSGIAIDPVGIIYPCYRFMGMEDTAIGDIYNGFDDEKRKIFFNYSRLGIEKCKKCPLNFRCHRCPWLSYTMTGDYSAPVDINCFEADLMIGLFRYFREKMEEENNPVYKKRIEGIKKRYFSPDSAFEFTAKDAETAENL